MEWVFYGFPNIFRCHDGTMSQATQVWSIFHCSDRSCSYDSPFPSSHLHSCRLVPCGKPVDPAIKQLAVGSSGPIHPSIHVYIYIYVYTYIYIYVYIYICIYVYVYTHTQYIHTYTIIYIICILYSKNMQY